MFHGEQPVEVVGGAETVPGVLHVWGRVGEGVPECRFAFHRTCKALVQYFGAKMRARRIQMHVHEGYEMGIKWAKALGFDQEGVMRKYGVDGSAFVLMARTF